jgi:methionyl-tRNA formyltransferase
MTDPARIVFMGSPAFAVPSLVALAAASHQVLAAVTQPDRPAGRGGRVRMPAVKEAALALGVPTLQPATLKEPAVRDELAALSPDLIVVAAYGRILPRSMLAIPAHGCVNVHASLLPRWRGASPIAAAILAGDPVTGVTIMEMTPEMDAGGVYAQAETPIGANDTTGHLEPRLANMGATLLVETLPGILNGRKRPVPQDEAAATFCRPLAKDDGCLRATMHVQEAARAVRAFNPWPGASVRYGAERLAIWAATAVVGSAGVPPGATAVLAGNRPAIAFNDGWLALDEVQRPGGRRLAGSAFLAGERGTLLQPVGLA